MTTRPARAPEILLGIALASALLGIWHPVSREALTLPATLVMTCAALAIARLVRRRLHAPLTLRFDHSGWTVWRHRRHGVQRYDGCMLVRGGYRSAALLVVRFATPAGERMSLDIWRGAVASAIFSRLHLALAYRTIDAAVPGRTRGRAALHSPARENRGARS